MAASLSRIQDRHGLGPRYASAYLSYWNRAQPAHTIRDMEDIERLEPPYSFWLEYALSTNWRGDELYRMVRSRLPLSAHRYLDVGCGFGGAVVAFGRRGFDAQGLEVDATRAGFARLNVEDHDLDAVIHEADVLDGVAERFGRFDVVTCMDVIEHVLEPERAIASLVEALRPGGVMVLEIPNMHSLEFVQRDGHFGLFGITLLGRHDARRYHEAVFGGDYDVGYYHPLDFYAERVAALGCTSRQLRNPMQPVLGWSRLQELVVAVLNARRRFVSELAPRLDVSLATLVEDRFDQYMGELAAALAGAARGQQRLDELQLRYLTNFWTVLVRKRGPGVQRLLWLLRRLGGRVGRGLGARRWLRGAPASVATQPACGPAAVREPHPREGLS